MTVKPESGAALWGAAALGYLLLEAVTAAAFEPPYSYLHNYISDLGAAGPRAHLMHAAFYLQGVLFLLGALLMVPRDRSTRLFLGLVGANALGNIVVGTVHSGTAHVVGAALAIAAGNVAILVGSTSVGEVVGKVAHRRWYPGVSRFIGTVGIGCFAMLAFDSVMKTAHFLPDGAWERGSVYSITLWQFLTAASLLLGSRHARAT